MDATAPNDLDRLAGWLSRVVHPFVISIPSLLLAIYLDTGSLAEAARWAAVGLVAFLVPFFFFVQVMVRWRRYSDADVSIRTQRGSLYLAGGACLIVFLAVLTLAGAPPISLACLYAAVLAVAIGSVINHWTKVSLHSVVAAGCAAGLFYLSPPLGLGLSLAAGLVGWSRVQLGQHTWGQVILGWVVAIACVIVVFGLGL